MLEMIATLRHEHAAELVVISDKTKRLGWPNPPSACPPASPNG